MKIVVVSGSRPWMKQLACRLIRQFPGHTVGWIVEETDSWSNRLHQLFRRLRRYGLVATLDQVRLQLHLLGCSHQEHDTKEQDRVDCPVLCVSSVNDARVVRFLSDHRPDLLVNLGGGIMKRSIFELPRMGSINVHPGICPWYRGANANFWALHQNDLANVGVTVHRITERIDAGEIFFQERIEVVRGKDTIETITLHAYEAGVRAVAALLEEVKTRGGLPTGKPQPAEGRTYGWYGLTDYRKVEANLRSP